MALRMSLRKNSLYLLQSNLMPWRADAYTTKAGATLEAVGKSLAARGFLRPNKPYDAPPNVAQRIREICASLQVSSESTYNLATLDEKCKVLTACFESFKHGVPNAQMHELQSIGDIIAFYSQSLDTTVPYDALKKMDLPENLHVQYEYLRFHPETDAKFNGQTAFPKSSTLVTGLKYRARYAGHEAKRSWP